MMNFISDINLNKESPPVQATGIIGRESRRRVRVRYVDFWGILKEQLIPGGWRKFPDELPKENYKGQATVAAESCPNLKRRGKERRNCSKKKKKKDRKKKSKGKLTEPLHGKSTYKAAAEVYAYVYLTVHRSPDLKYFGMRLQFGEF